MLKPPAEISLSESQVRELLVADCREYAHLPLRLVAEGWDNAVWRLGDELAVRLPRRAVAAELIRHEQRALPLLAARTTVAVPLPLHVGAPRGPMPWPWSVVPWFPGRALLAVPRSARGGVAAPLAAFLRAVHAPAPSDAPPNPVRGVPLAARSVAVEERFAGGLVPRSNELRPVWEEALTAPLFDGEPVWIHGDLHPGNIVVTGPEHGAGHRAPGPALAAVVDFGDVTAGDPATDLAAAWLCFDPAGRRAFRAAYGDDDSSLWARARGWAVVLATALCGNSLDDPEMARLGHETVDEVLARGEGGRVRFVP
ncbi:aminoglycoside phosphotransferase family protein [Planctomonas deserti]|uniref:aminoglycoside phosphotransferase family protein n=1 Tax=Planctomonas deserti TaxID=2144185 RepID=UPI000D3D2677|nr:aminoglycoside phosphotransferase family protein [Planctomonas deserti]